VKAEMTSQVLSAKKDPLLRQDPLVQKPG
jgi:hypothetical protein